MTNVAIDRIRSYVERIEKLEVEKAALAEDIKEVYSEAKGVGLDAKILCKVISLRKKDSAALQEEAELVRLYADALGMQLELGV